MRGCQGVDYLEGGAWQGRWGQVSLAGPAHGG